MHIFEPKKHITLYYKNNVEKKNTAQIRAKKAPNTTLKKLREEKKKYKFKPKKHLALPYKNDANIKRKMHRFEPKRRLTLLYKNYTKKKKCRNSSQKIT